MSCLPADGSHRARLAALAVTLATLAPACTTPPAETAAAEEPPAAASGSPGAKKHRNRLADETSPYLLLHAHNPVDWYPWGPEALAKAQRENKPIFLSIGYSSCHWCHVMERESFLDEEIAAYLNEHFVCIKVDREERPDIDSIYMTALQVFHQLIGSRRGGGWPLSMFLTPDAKPFFGGTYFPARDGDRGAGSGFLTIIRRINEVWRKDPDKIKEDAATIARFTRTELEGQARVAPKPLDRSLADAVQAGLKRQFDPEYGGFGYAPATPQRPKFPEPSNLLFLLEQVRRCRAAGQPDDAPRKMLELTLERMSMGGIRDHLGGGFHRYSVDRFWKIPHFEKMLYDNGQLATVYAEAYRLTGREDFRRVVVELLDFVQRELTDPQGGFYAALDAESENEEGKFYRWQRESIRDALGDESYRLFARVYGIDQPPNFEEQYYAPQLSQPLGELARQLGVTEAELETQLAPQRARLRALRDGRPRPLTDTKILTAWNGLMVRGFADAGRLLEQPRYVQVAERAADFALTHLRRDDGRLWRSYGAGVAKLNAYLDDYAFLVDGLIALHRATGDRRWLEAGEQLTEKQIELFWDEEGGGFFFTSRDHEQLLARAKNPIDGALPAGNSVAADNLVYLGLKLERPEYLVKAGRTIQSAAALLDNAPAAAPRLALAASRWLDAQPADDQDE